MHRYISRTIAFLGGLLGLGIITKVLFNIVLNQDWNASPFIFLMFIGNLLVVISALKFPKHPFIGIIWAGVGLFQAYFAYLSRFTIGVYLLPQVLLLFLATLWDISKTNKISELRNQDQNVEHPVDPIMKPVNSYEETFTQMTSRESQVLFWITQGKSNQEIAQILVVSQNTVRHHVHQVLKKLNCSSRGEAAALARKAGWRFDD